MLFLFLLFQSLSLTLQCHEYHELAAPSTSAATTASNLPTTATTSPSSIPGSASSNSSGGGTISGGVNGNALLRNEQGEPQLVTRLL